MKIERVVLPYRFNEQGDLAREPILSNRQDFEMGTETFAVDTGRKNYHVLQDGCTQRATLCHPQ